MPDASWNVILTVPAPPLHTRNTAPPAACGTTAATAAHTPPPAGACRTARTIPPAHAPGTSPGPPKPLRVVARGEMAGVGAFAFPQFGRVARHVHHHRATAGHQHKPLRVGFRVNGH